MKTPSRILAAVLACASTVSLTTPALAASVSLTEQYTFGGAVNPWYAEESYFSAPVAADLDGDGRLEVVNAAHSISVLDAATGEIKWQINSGKDRSSAFSAYGNVSRQIFPDIQVKDVDGDGQLEIVAGYADGTVSVLSSDGYFKAGWPQKPSSDSIRSLAVEDLDGDGRCEIIVGVGTANPKSVWAYDAGGQVLPGWPQLSDNQNGTHVNAKQNTAYSYGVFANAIAVGNLDADPELEIIVPTDMAYISAYNLDGSLVTASPVYESRAWGKVALYEDYDQEIACENEGWGWKITGDETREELYRAELGHSAAVYSDVDGDGTSEVVVTALMIDRTHHSQTDLVTTADTRYMTVFILNQDRTRYKNQALGFDWTAAPRDLGGPLKAVDTQSVATGVFSEPVCADIDGDGYQEILFTDYSGKLHCFSLDGTEHGAWPFVLPHTTDQLYEYATTPTCRDLDGDGRQEVIFASWIGSDQGENTGVNGNLYVTDYKGNLLCSLPLHDGYATYEGVIDHSNNVFATPLVQDVDGDGKYEILLNTTYYGLCAYEVHVQPPTADPSPAAVTLDGAPITLNAYNKDQTTYVMLRDVAYLLSGTAAQFEVRWQEGGILLTTGEPYTPVGGELQGKGEGSKPYTANTSAITVDGSPVRLEAFTIEGNNYFKLRDLGKALGFNVRWDAASGTIQLSSDQPYTGE